MDIKLLIELMANVAFPVLVSFMLIIWLVKSSAIREQRMWETINGFNSTLVKFDKTLKEVATGLKEVRTKVEKVEKDIDSFKNKNTK